MSKLVFYASSHFINLCTTRSALITFVKRSHWIIIYFKIPSITIIIIIFTQIIINLLLILCFSPSIHLTVIDRVHLRPALFSYLILFTFHIRFACFHKLFEFRTIILISSTHNALSLFLALLICIYLSIAVKLLYV